MNVLIDLSKYIVEIYNRKYKVEIFANDNIRYRNKQRIIRNEQIIEIKMFYSYRNLKFIKFLINIFSFIIFFLYVIVMHNIL